MQGAARLDGRRVAGVAMIIYVLIFLAWGKNLQPHFIPGVYPDRFNCEAAEGEMATLLQKDKEVTGWVIYGEPCQAVPEAKKV
jgi:hypothetical protein